MAMSIGEWERAVKLEFAFCKTPKKENQFICERIPSAFLKTTFLLK